MKFIVNAISDSSVSSDFSILFIVCVGGITDASLELSLFLDDLSNSSLFVLSDGFFKNALALAKSELSLSLGSSCWVGSFVLYSSSEVMYSFSSVCLFLFSPLFDLSYSFISLP